MNKTYIIDPNLIYYTTNGVLHYPCPNCNTYVSQRNSCNCGIALWHTNGRVGIDKGINGTTTICWGFRIYREEKCMVFVKEVKRGVILNVSLPNYATTIKLFPFSIDDDNLQAHINNFNEKYATLI